MFNCPKCQCDNSSIAIICQKCSAWMPYAIPYVKEEWRKYLASEKGNPILTIDEWWDNFKDKPKEVSKVNDEFAFPQEYEMMNPIPNDGEMHAVTYATHIHHGMLLRDYFAAKAMQALIAQDINMGYTDVALEGYKHADAMLKAREPKKE